MARKIAVPAPDRRYEVEDAMRILARAQQIRRDAKLMEDVRVLASDLKKIAGRAAGKGK